MSALDLVLFTALLGAGAVARRQELAQPPAELLENLDMFQEMPFLDDVADSPDAEAP
jgi:hypothetical protein